MKRTAKHGEEHLGRVLALRITLESGATVTVRPQAELAISDDPEEQARQLESAPARYAFIAYQEERALHAVRLLEAALKDVRSQQYLLQRKYIDEHTSDVVTEPHVAARVDAAPDVIEAEKALALGRKRYGVLRALRQGLDHRVRSLQRLVAHHGTQHG